MKLIYFRLFSLLSTTVLAENSGSYNENDEANQFLRSHRGGFFERNTDGNEAIDSYMNNAIETRIIGGTSASKNEFPSFVNWELGCGGSLISPNLVLTAAHCLAAEWNPYARVGAIRRSDGIMQRIVAVAIHPSYDPYFNQYDFAVLRLENDVTSSVTPIVLNRDTNAPSNGNNLVAIGLGLTSQSGTVSNRLQKVTVPYVTSTKCSFAYPGQIDNQSMLCAGQQGKDSCQGDSGGPLVDARTGTQVGVVSFGAGCGARGFPGVYSRITGAIDWIDDQICLHASTNLPPPACKQKTLKPITFQIKFDSYPLETSWNLRKSNGKIFFALPKGTGLKSKLVSNTFNLQPGSYTFEIEDTYGDGLCCSGDYKIIGGGGTIIEGDSSFTTSDIITFDVLNDGSIATKEYEKPASNDIHQIFLDIEYDFLAFQTQWKITNIDNAELEYISPFNSMFFPGLVTYQLNLSNGSYLFEIEDAASNWIINRYRQSVRIVEKDTFSGKDKVLLQVSGSFGAYERYAFELS